MPKGKGKRHTAREHRIAAGVKRSNPRWSERRVWKTVMSMGRKVRGRRK